MQWTNPMAPSECKNQGIVVQRVLQDGITITVKNCKRNPLVVQFIHREQKLLNEKLEAGAYERSIDCKTKRSLALTTDDTSPAWHLDGTPYYNSYRKDCRSKQSRFDDHLRCAQLRWILSEEIQVLASDVRFLCFVRRRSGSANPLEANIGS